MKRLLCIATLIVLVASCKKTIEEQTPPPGPADEVPEVNGGGPLEWTTFPVPSNNPLNSATGSNNVIAVNGTAFCLIGSSLNPTVYKLNTATTRWELFDDFDIHVPYARYLFSHGSKIYWGLSANSSGYYNNFSCIDVITGVKTTLTTFPGEHVGSPTTFVIGDKGYFLGGYSPDDETVNQHWEYNFLTGVWTDKGGSPLGARSGACAFVVGNKAYIGLGFDKVIFNGNPITLYKDDWILYNPGSSYHGIMTDFPAANRAYAKGFVIDGLPYVGFGSNGTLINDLWRYNISGNSWTQQPSWPGTISSSNNIGIFTLNNTGYVVKGGINQFWSYGN